MKKICPECKLEWIPHPKMKHFRDNIFWTFTKKEDKNSYLIDLEVFTQFSYEFLVKNIKYIFLDLIIENKTKIKRIIKNIKQINPIHYYIYRNRMIYLYGHGVLIGIDLDLCEFIGINKKKVISKLSTLKNATLLSDDILITYKSVLTRLNDNVKFFPFLYSIDEKNHSTSFVSTTNKN